MTEDEFLAHDAASDRPNEFWFGRAFYRDGESSNHCHLAARLMTAFCTSRGEVPFHVGGSLLRLRLDEPRSYAYPDVVVWSDNAKWSDDNHDTLLTPLLLVEIVSPQTRTRDFEWKLEAYKCLPCLFDYLIVSQTRVGIEHFRRSGSTWEAISYNRRAQIIRFGFENLEIPVGEIYRRVDVPEQLLLWEEDED